MTNDAVHQASEKQTAYTKYREELYKSILSNSENLDRTLITLSSASLAFSLVLIDKIVPFPTASFTLLIYFSWFCFAGSMISVIISYLIGQKAIRLQLEYAAEFFLKNKEEFSNKENRLYFYCECATLISSVCFMIGIITMVLFAVINLNLKESKMSKNKPSVIQESAPILPMPQTSASQTQRAAPILPMAPNQANNQTPVVSPQPAAQTQPAAASPAKSE